MRCSLIPRHLSTRPPSYIQTSTPGASYSEVCALESGRCHTGFHLHSAGECYKNAVTQATTYNTVSHDCSDHLHQRTHIGLKAAHHGNAMLQEIPGTLQANATYVLMCKPDAARHRGHRQQDRISQPSAAHLLQPRWRSQPSQHAESRASHQPVGFLATERPVIAS